MTPTNRFGIVGGYGATGSAVVTALLKSCEGGILTGGRDLNKGMTAAAEQGSRVSATHVDVLDAGSLDDFCSRCSIVVNCAGPVMLLQDRAAHAAFRSRSHYVDVAGLTFVKEGMLLLYLSGFRTAAAWMLIALLPLPEGLAVRLLRKVFRRNRLAVDGFAVVHVLGIGH